MTGRNEIHRGLYIHGYGRRRATEKQSKVACGLGVSLVEVWKDK
jgi:hypothetical protein